MIDADGQLQADRAAARLRDVVLEQFGPESNSGE